MDRLNGEVPERLALARLDQAAIDFSKSFHYLEALECMEKAMVLRIKLCGPRSEEVSVGVGLPCEKKNNVFGSERGFCGGATSNAFGLGLGLGLGSDFECLRRFGTAPPSPPSRALGV